VFCEYVYCADAVTMNDGGVTSHAVEQACDRGGGRKRRERRSEQLHADSELLHMSTDYVGSLEQSTDHDDLD